MYIVRFRKAIALLLLLITIGSGSEPTEVNRIPPSEGRKRPRRHDILGRFKEEERSRVADLLDDSSKSVEEKLDLLKMMITEATLFLDVHCYLVEMECDFLCLLESEDKRKRMEKLIKNGDFVLLEMLVAREPEAVRRAFEKWKLTGRPMTIVSNDVNSEEDNETTSSEKDQVHNEPIRKQSFNSQGNSSIQSETHSETSENIDMEPPKIDTSFLKNLPKCLTILVMGQTGSGKSTFINAIVNYLKYSSISEAEQKGLEILIKTAFTHVTRNCEDIRIECYPTIEVEIQGEENDEEQEVTVAGESSTQSPKSYVFTFGPEGNEKKIRIIDTPGVGDVRGLGQEKKNFDKILKFIANFKNIHAICILLKSNESKHTVMFRYCINELLAHLHESASKNIIFGFTNARASLYTPGESLPTLKEHLKKLRIQKNVEIQLNRDTMFCFDNESFRFLCTHSKNISQFSQREIREFNYSWNKSVEETFRLFKRISELEPHKVRETLSVNNIRRILFSFVRPMAEIARSQLKNDDLIEEKQTEVENYIINGRELTGRLTSQEVVIVPKELDYPVTVCIGKGCVEYKRYHPNARLETVFITKCHARCDLKNIKTESYPNPDLQKCWAMMLNINQCRNCGCPWSTHLHIRYELNNVVEEKVDPTVQKSIDSNDDKRKTAQLFLQQLQHDREEKRKETALISQACAEMVAFLRRYSILPYNDAFAEYCEHLINEEQEKVNRGDDAKILNQLTEFRDDYKEQVRLLSELANQGDITSKLKDVDQLIKRIKKLKHSGKILSKIEKIELLSVRKQPAVKGKTVDLNSGWMGEVDVGEPGKKKLGKTIKEKYSEVKKSVLNKH